MARKGTIILLGAGASAEAGYPTAEGLLEHFKTLLREESEAERDVAKNISEQIGQLMERSGGDRKSVPQLQNTQKLEEW